MDFLILSFKDIRIVNIIFTDQFVWSGPHFFMLFEDQVCSRVKILYQTWNNTTWNDNACLVCFLSK